MSGRWWLWSWRLLATLFATPVLAGVSYDPALTWQTLFSPHFRVHFHDGEKQLARRAVAIAEQVNARLAPLIGWMPETPVDIVLSDRQDISNGYTTFFPSDRMTICVTPSDEVNSLEDRGDWLEFVLTHEYVHALHLDRASDAPYLLRSVFGRNPLLFPNSLQPTWLIEGLAVHDETDRARGIGRGQSSYFDMFMRMEVAHGLKPLRQINQAIVTWPAGYTPYLYGVAYYGFVADHYGEPAIRRLVDNYSSNLIPFRINSNSEQVLGADETQLWAAIDKSLNERHGARLQQIRAAGLVAGERLTSYGYSTGAVRALPDGDIVFVRNDGGHPPAVMRRRVDGSIRQLAELHSGAHIAVHPRAGVLVAQPELYRNANLFYDLYRIDLETGAETRLTHGARYRYAAWSPDGTRILAVHNEGGQHALHLLDAKGRLLDVLFAGEPDVVFADPDWSPDGRSVALAAWRPQTGWNLEQFLVSERRFVPLTRDAAIEAQPQFTADGRALLFSSDHGGVYNLRCLDLASGRITTLTNVEGGAFHPAQARPDGPIYYTGYNPDGFDIYRLDTPASLPTPPAAKGPSAAVTPEPAPPAGLRVEDYSPYDGLRPRWWLPHVLVDSQRTELGVMTSAWDPLLRHIYYLDAAYDFSNQWFTGSLDYIYDRLYPTFKLHASRYSTLYLDPNNDPARITTADTYLGEAVLPFLRYRRDVTLHAAAYSVRDADSWTAAGVTPQAPRRDNVLGYALVYDSTRRYPLSISRSNGMQLSVAAETSDALSGSSYSGEVYTFDGRAFLALGHEHVLATRLTYGWGSAQPRPFVLGGSRSADEAPLPLDAAVLNSPFDQRRVALRGYDSGAAGLVGRRMFAGSLEWRFPLQRIERGFMAPPVGLNQVYGSLFAETGDAWDNGRHPDNTFSDAGLEAHADVVLFYQMLFHLRLGYAYGYADNGGHRVYLQFGSSF